MCALRQLTLLTILCWALSVQAVEGESPQASWLTQAQQGLVLGEYQASENDLGLQAPNRAQDFRTYFSGDGIRIVARDVGSKSIAGLAFDSVGRGLVAAGEALTGQAEVFSDGANVTLRWPGVEARYTNSVDGLRQRLAVVFPAAGSGQLTLAWTVTGATVQMNAGEVVLHGESDSLRMGPIKAHDGIGRDLPVSLTVDHERLLLTVDDRHAVYPIQFEALITKLHPLASDTIRSLIDGVADAQMESNAVGASLGWSVAAAGDVNGDGIGDVIVGAYRYDNGENSEGAAFLYFGGGGSFDTIADAQLESNQVDARLGFGVAGAGDVNGDGFDDVIVGAYQYDNGQTNEGAAFVYFGGPGNFNQIADAQLESNQAEALSGWSVSGAGDVNGDGLADVIVGAPYFANGQFDEGAALLYFGGLGSFDTDADALLESNQADAQFGYSVAGIGDVNSDGFADVLVGARAYDNGQHDEGAAFLYFGGAGAFDTGADALLESNQLDSQFGHSVAGAGDLNGDGVADVIVGAPHYSNGHQDEGAVFIYFGGAGAFNTVVDARLESNLVRANLGFSVAGAGDVNGDGIADIVVGAPMYNIDQINEGAAFVYFGKSGAFDPVADAQTESNQENANLGFSVAGAGDIDGDGFADVIVGAPLYDNDQTNEGVAFIYFGTGKFENLIFANGFE